MDKDNNLYVTYQDFIDDKPYKKIIDFPDDNGNEQLRIVELDNDSKEYRTLAHERSLVKKKIHKYVKRIWRREHNTDHQRNNSIDRISDYED